VNVCAMSLLNSGLPPNPAPAPLMAGAEPERRAMRAGGPEFLVARRARDARADRAEGRPAQSRTRERV